MSVAKITEIQASSTKSFDNAIQTVRANKTLRNVTGAWIKSQKVVVDNGKVTEYRVLDEGIVHLAGQVITASPPRLPHALGVRPTRNRPHPSV